MAAAPHVVTWSANGAPKLAEISIRDARGHVVPGSLPVMATPGAFTAGVAIASAVLGANELGKAAAGDSGIQPA
ncbi:hypothetical protein [Streptomyces sp. TRM49041]|uniref:hypothetical protein n=1 Tax=Streptomyces sp. TRM49041 TaxID=2603216 RepID=UPI0011EF0F9C|nr:hypothetical protein [Streptomyces sp. TRM49041]